MILSELWAELKALPQTLGKPLHDPIWFRQHTAAHLVGGPLWWGGGMGFMHGIAAGVLALLGRSDLIHLAWFPLLSLAFAVAATVVRQGFMREAKGVGEFPLYAMVWDSVTSGLAAGVWAVAFAVARG